MTAIARTPTVFSFNMLPIHVYIHSMVRALTRDKAVGFNTEEAWVPFIDDVTD